MFLLKYDTAKMEAFKATLGDSYSRSRRHRVSWVFNKHPEEGFIEAHALGHLPLLLDRYEQAKAYDKML